MMGASVTLSSSLYGSVSRTCFCRMCCGFYVQPDCHEWGLIAGIAKREVKTYRCDVLCGASRVRERESGMPHEFERESRVEYYIACEITG